MLNGAVHFGFDSNLFRNFELHGLSTEEFHKGEVVYSVYAGFFYR